MNQNLSTSPNLNIIKFVHRSELLGASFRELQKFFPYLNDLEFRLRLLSHQGVLSTTRYMRSVGPIYFLTPKAKALYGTSEFHGMLEVHIPVRITTEWIEELADELITCKISDNELLTPYGWCGEDIVATAHDGDIDSLISITTDTFENNLPEWIRGSIMYDITEN